LKQSTAAGPSWRRAVALDPGPRGIGAVCKPANTTWMTAAGALREPREGGVRPPSSAQEERQLAGGSAWKGWRRWSSARACKATSSGGPSPSFVTRPERGSASSPAPAKWHGEERGATSASAVIGGGSVIILGLFPSVGALNESTAGGLATHRSVRQKREGARVAQSDDIA